MFLFVPDVPQQAKIGPAIRAGLANLRMSLAQARTNRNIFPFLLSNMIFKDGLVALFAFGGIYAAGQLGWGSIEIGTFGIILTITGTLGLLLGGPMDDRFGAKPVIVFSLIVLMICGLGMISIDRTTVFFVIKTAAAPRVPSSHRCRNRCSLHSAVSSARCPARCRPPAAVFWSA